MRSMQDLLDDDLKVRVGLMEKTWTNWASIFFLQELSLERTEKGKRLRSSLRSVVQSVADDWGFGQVVGEAGDMLRLTIISLPHWIQQAAEKLHDTGRLVGTFRVVSVKPMRQLTNPTELFELGYFGE